MIKQIFILSAVILCFGCRNATTSKSHETTRKNTTTSKPYEATWLELNKTETGYVINNYPSLRDDGETISPHTITIKQDSLIWHNYMDLPVPEIFDEAIFNDVDSSYLFPVGNYYRFMWADEEKHIARWIIYHGKEPEMRVMHDLLFVDSLYNTYPIVDYKWDFNFKYQ